MSDVSKEQAKEVLSRLGSYGYWMFYRKGSDLDLAKRKIKTEDKEFNIFINKDGTYSIPVEDWPVAIFDIQIVTAEQRPGTLDNFEYKCIFKNPSEFSKEQIEFFSNRVAFYLKSLFQRTIAFTFFANAQPESIESIAKDLMSFIPKDKHVDLGPLQHAANN